MTASKLGSGVDRAKVIPFPPIERMGVIGDRRTAALVGADGTLCWMCLPNYDGSPVFGCLLDPLRGGYWKFGPRRRCLGRQDYMPDTAILTTRWDIQGATLELVDAMAWPHDDRGKENVIRRVVLRRLRCLEGSIECELSCAPRRDFENDYAVRQLDAHTVAFTGLETLALWCSSPLAAQDDRVDAAFRLDVGQEIWCVFGPREEAFGWTAEKAAEVMQSTADFWNGWLKPVAAPGRRRDHIRRSALLVHLLTFADTGAVIAAPTTSLPERIGGGRNYDYRFTWIRDASLSLAFLAKLGLTADAKRYMHWLAGLDAEDGAPLQVLYRIDGGRETPLVERGDLHGYRGSRPVRFGNIASQLVESGSANSGA